MKCRRDSYILRRDIHTQYVNSYTTGAKHSGIVLQLIIIT